MKVTRIGSSQAKALVAKGKKKAKAKRSRRPGPKQLKLHRADSLSTASLPQQLKGLSAALKRLASGLEGVKSQALAADATAQSVLGSLR